MRTNRRSSSFAPWSLLLAATPLAAQSTVLVGPGGLPQIRDALAIAAPGDVIHVLPGTFAHFEANVGVTIRALVPGSVTVEYDPAFLPPGCSGDPTCEFASSATRFAPPSGQAVHVAGIHFAPTESDFGRHGVVVSSGAVTFDGCTIESPTLPMPPRSALQIDDAQVHLQNCIVHAHGVGDSHGVVASDSNLIVVDSSISSDGPFSPDDGMRLLNSTLRATGCTIQGGLGFFGGLGSVAVRSDAASRIWISDSELRGGTGHCAIAGDPAVCEIARTTLLNNTGPCTVPTVTPLVGVVRSGPLQNGGAFSVQVRTEPNHIVAIHASPKLAHIEIPGLLAQPMALDIGSFFLAGLFVSDATGNLTASWTLPVGQYIDETIWLEPCVLRVAAPILVGPPVGGLIR